MNTVTLRFVHLDQLSGSKGGSMHTCPKNRYAAEHGFSLLELMVTLVITGIFMTAVFQIFMMQQKVTQDQSRVQEAQQGLRIAMDLINNDFRSGTLESMDIHINDNVSRTIGLFLRNAPNGEPDSLFIFRLVRDVEYEATSRRSLLVSPGDTLIATGGDAFADTMTSTEGPIRLADVAPLRLYISDNGMDSSFTDYPMPIGILGPDLIRYSDWVTVDGVPWRDLANFQTTVPELAYVTGITYSANYDELEISTVHTLLNPSPSDPGLIRRYGYFGYPPSTVAPRIFGVVPTPGTSDIVVRPVKVVGWYVQFDDIVDRFRLFRFEDGRSEIVADDITDFQVTTDNEKYVITLQSKIARFGRSQLSVNPDDFITKSDSLIVYPDI